MSSVEFQSDFIRIQPDWCRKPLPKKELVNTSDIKDFERRILFYDPTEVYNRLKYTINPYQRSLNASMSKVFPTPKDKTLCACGCGQKASENSRWATDECWGFVNGVWCIISGITSEIKRYLFLYHGECCSECGATNNGVEADYKHPVSAGGGGGWLSNYKPLCFMCYDKKYPKPVKNTKVWVKSQPVQPKVETKAEKKKIEQKKQIKMDFLSITGIMEKQNKPSA